MSVFMSNFLLNSYTYLSIVVSEGNPHNEWKGNELKMNKMNVGANTNILQILLDMLIITVSFAVSILIDQWNTPFHQMMNMVILLLIFTVIFLLSNKEAQVYNITLFYYLDRIQRKVTRSFLLGAVATLGIMYFMTGVEVNHQIFIIFLIITYVLLTINVFFFRKFIEKRLSNNTPRTAFVGKIGAFNKFRYFLKKTSIQIVDVGYISMTKEELTDGYIGSLENLEELIREYNIDQVYIMQKNDDTLTYIQHYLDICIDMGVTARLIIDIYKRRKSNSFVSSVGTYPIITYHTICLNRGSRMVKRTIDIIGGFLGIVLSSPIMLFTAIAIKIESPGPVLFKQVRVGQNGRHFKIYKFRSMYKDAEARKAELMAQNEIKGGIMFKMKDDPRITKVGKFIRKTSIDELPQFFNILKGDMSLVGTRPPTLDEVEKYERTQWKRISIKPGLTGMWQVNGRSKIDNFDEIVELDVEYIDTWSLLLDIKILVKTVTILFSKKGAY